MKSPFYRTAAPVITKMQQLFSDELATENDPLRQGNRILRIKGPSGAATMLGLKPSTLYSRMQKLGIPTHRQKTDGG
jgi:hypothetical protein